MSDFDDFERIRQQRELMRKMTLKQFSDNDGSSDTKKVSNPSQQSDFFAVVTMILTAPIGLVFFLFDGRRAWITLSVCLLLYTIGYFLGYTD